MGCGVWGFRFRVCGLGFGGGCAPDCAWLSPECPLRWSPRTPARNPKPETRNPEPETQHPKPETSNPELYSLWTILSPAHTSGLRLGVWALGLSAPLLARGFRQNVLFDGRLAHQPETRNPKPYHPRASAHLGLEVERLGAGVGTCYLVGVGLAPASACLSTECPLRWSRRTLAAALAPVQGWRCLKFKV